MRIYITSDSHFCHSNIIRYCDRKFASVSEMNRQLITCWNDVVKGDDIVIHVGDLIMGKHGNNEWHRAVVKSLNGNVVLIRGNHDGRPEWWYHTCGITNVLDNLMIGGCLFVHHPPHSFMHNRVRKLYRDPDDVIAKSIAAKYVIHGHDHNGERWNGNRYNACVDVSGYTPVLLDRIVDESTRDAVYEFFNAT